MIETLLKLALDILKLAPRYLLAIAVASALLLCLTPAATGRLGLTVFMANYRQWVGLAFLFSTCVSAVSISIWAWDSLTDRIESRRSKKIIVKKLGNLNEDEKQILRFYLAKGTRSNTLRMDDGVVMGLVFDGIIFRSSNQGNLLHGFAHNISDFSWDYIHENPEVLLGDTNTYRTDKPPHGRLI